jgi:hypothetical protein
MLPLDRNSLVGTGCDSFFADELREGPALAAANVTGASPSGGSFQPQFDPLPAR